MKLRLTLTALALLVVSALPAQAGVFFAWSGPRCVEFTPGGHFIRFVSRNICRRVAPTHPLWVGRNCGEYTPRGSFLGWLRRDACRYALLDLNEGLKKSAQGTAVDAVAELEGAKGMSDVNADAPASLEATESKIHAE